MRRFNLTNSIRSNNGAIRAMGVPEDLMDSVHIFSAFLLAFGATFSVCSFRGSFRYMAGSDGSTRDKYYAALTGLAAGFIVFAVSEGIRAPQSLRPTHSMNAAEVEWVLAKMASRHRQMAGVMMTYGGVGALFGFGTFKAVSKIVHCVTDTLENTNVTHAPKKP